MMGLRTWSWISIVLFALSMLSYPTYVGHIHGWPVNFLLSVGTGVLYFIIYGFFIKDKLKRED